MAEVSIRIADIEAMKPLLDAVAAVAGRWESMARSYGHSKENVELAELLDTLTDAARNLGEKRK